MPLVHQAYLNIRYCVNITCNTQKNNINIRFHCNLRCKVRDTVKGQPISVTNSPTIDASFDCIVVMYSVTDTASFADALQIIENRHESTLTLLDLQI